MVREHLDGTTWLMAWSNKDKILSALAEVNFFFFQKKKSTLTCMRLTIS